MAIRVQRGTHTEPLIPDVAGLTTQVFKELSTFGLDQTLVKVLKHFETDCKPAPNIEDFLSHIRLLLQVAGKDSVRGLTSDELRLLDEAACKSISVFASVGLPDQSTPYHHLTAWLGSIRRFYPLQLFTTNYDLLLEQALEENRVPYFDGFVGTRDTFFDLQAIEQDPLPERWARLWKIHGSVNWSVDKGGKVRRRSSPESTHLIYPSHLKYDESRRMPYLAMLDRLRAFLSQPAAILIICGYSFRDEHLNEVIVQGLQGNSTASGFGLLHSNLGDYPAAIQLAATRSNLNLLAKDGGILGTRRAEWIPSDGNPGDPGAPAVEWKPDPNNANRFVPSFVLGDFGKLGVFLLEIIGAAEKQPNQATVLSVTGGAHAV